MLIVPKSGAEMAEWMPVRNRVGQSRPGNPTIRKPRRRTTILPYFRSNEIGIPNQNRSARHYWVFAARIPLAGARLTPDKSRATSATDQIVRATVAIFSISPAGPPK